MESNIDVKSNIDIESNIVLATPWNRFRYNVVLHNWWIFKGYLGGRWHTWIGKKKC